MIGWRSVFRLDGLTFQIRQGLLYRLDRVALQIRQGLPFRFRDVKSTIPSVSIDFSSNKANR